MARTYLDHAATTPMVPEAVEAMTRELSRARKRVFAARLRAGRPGRWSRRRGSRSPLASGPTRVS